MLTKFKENAPGRFFTTDCCIACDACRVYAPKNFAKTPEGYYVVIKQPSSDEELRAVLEVYANTFAPMGPGPCIIDSEDFKR